MASILVTGGTGLIGKKLCELLRNKGHKVAILSRNQHTKPNSYYWNSDTRYIDAKAIVEADYIIHLAGEGIADKRWTEQRKNDLINSRIKTANLLFEKVKELNPNLKGFISASGIGYYDATTSEKIYEENDAPGNDFINEMCKVWEKASLQFDAINIRTVIFRTGVVLTKEGGALKKLSQPIKLGVGAPIGSGEQYIPWIHIEDLCNMYVEAIENSEIKGIYNAVAPEHVTNKALTKIIAKKIKKPLWLPNIPAFVMKLILGEMTVIILEGSRVSSEKIMATGFKFNYPNINEALDN
ncbi:MAG: TIGR01777 family protein [Bacteroidetes bacterium HGW-Bacteroidetes-15]|nr:MAG: TIGR01777 family protein [Bacteroidetes bacterium HGW-Bacteroidetes-15]